MLILLHANKRKFKVLWKLFQLKICHEELHSAQWFSRDEVRTAYENTVSDPGMLKHVNDPNATRQFHYIPPFGTVAHRMIKCWLDGSN